MHVTAIDLLTSIDRRLSHGTGLAMTQDHLGHRPDPSPAPDQSSAPEQSVALIPRRSAGTPDQARRDAGTRLPDAAVDASFSEGAPADAPANALADERRAFRRLGPGFRPPVAGALCVIFAVVAFYRTTLLLAPLAIIAGIVALCRRQYAWAAIGIIAAGVALLTDITFWSLLGVAWMVKWLVWS